jgi:hypothetical protein
LARYNYFNSGDHYSEWHRIHEGIAMIDIDSVEICSNKGCWQPLAIIENVYDVGKYNKYTTVVEFIAEKLGIPAYLVYYKPIGTSQQSLEFKIMRLKPFKSVLEGVYEEDWLAELRSLQDEHRKVCKHNK